MLDRDYASVYTKPDTTDNRSTFLNVTTRHSLSARLALSATRTTATSAPTRSTATSTRTRSTRRSISPSAAERAALAAAGYTGVPDQRRRRGQHAVPVLALHRQRAAQRRAGREVQRPDQSRRDARSTTAARSASSRGAIAFGRGEQSVHRGGGYDRSRVGFVAVDRARLPQSRSQRHRRRRVRRRRDWRRGRRRAVRHPRRSRRPDPDLEPLRHRHAVDRPAPGTSPLSGRYNRTTVANRDRIEPGGGPGSLDGDHVFSRFNPAAGVTFSPSRDGQLLRAATARAAARRRRSSSAAPIRTSRASCRTRWPAIRRSIRSSRGRSRRARAATRRGVELERRLVPRRQPRRHPVRHVRSRPASATSGISARRAARGSSSARTAGSDASRSAAATHSSHATYQSEETVNGESNSTNDAAEAGGAGSRARLRSSRAIACR